MLNFICVISAVYLSCVLFTITSRIYHSPTHSFMELSPSREVANCAATQELPSILWNTKAHYRVHKSTPLVPSPSMINSIHTIRLYLSKRKKSKAIPVTGPEGPSRYERSRLPHYLDNRLTDGGKVVSLTRRPPFIPRKNSW
jgi:hypothetical protein